MEKERKQPVMVSQSKSHQKEKFIIHQLKFIIHQAVDQAELYGECVIMHAYNASSSVRSEINFLLLKWNFVFFNQCNAAAKY